MKRTLIQRYATAIVSGMIQKVDSLSVMSHQLTKGELRELFVNNALKHFLTNQFSVTSGIIMNQKGDQSNQNDIIIYDNTKLPPFIKESNISVIPIETVLAVIEVKSNLTLPEILASEKKFERLRTVICDKHRTVFPKNLNSNYTPLLGLIGFYGNGPKILNSDVDVAKQWLKNNVKYSFAICLARKYTWLRLEPWKGSFHDPETFEETKRFIAVILDNIRTLSNSDLYRADGKHQDWLSIYLRDQPAITSYFESKRESY